MSRSAVLIADQGLNSATNVVVTVLVARQVSLQQFGVFATVQFAVVLGQTITLGALGDRWLQADPDERARRFATGIAVYRTAALVAIAVGVALVLTFGFSALVVGMVAIPAIAGLDYVRVVLFAEVRLKSAVGMDAAFGGLQLLCIIGWTVGDGWHGAAGAWLAWAAAAYAVFAVFASGAVRAQPFVGRADRAPIGDSFSARYAAEALVLNGGAQLSLLVVTARLGVAFTGLLRITQIPFGPLIVLIQAGRALLIPAFRVADDRGGQRLLVRVAVGYTLLCGAFTGVTYAFTDNAGPREFIGGLHPPPEYVFLSGLLFLTAGLHLLVFYYFRARQWDAAVTCSRVVLVAALVVSTVSGALTASATVYLALLSLTWATAALAMVGYQLHHSGRSVIVTVRTAAIAVEPIPLLKRLGLGRAGVLATCAAAVSAPWNAVLLGRVRPGDLLLLVALVCFVAAGGVHDWPRPPWWVLQLAATIVVLAAIHQLAPAGHEFIRQHTSYAPNGRAITTTPSNVGVAARWLVSVVGVTLIMSFAVQHRRSAAQWIATCFAAGAAVSGLVAVSDRLGLTRISAAFIAPDPTGRQAGLTVHPNHLAAGCVLAIPIALWLISRSSARDRVVGTACLLAALLGTYVSGSRGGAVASVVAVVLSLLVLRRFRPGLPVLAFAAVAGALVAVAVRPAFIDHLVAATRLGGDESTAASDAARNLALEQGVADFLHSPVIGVGLQVVQDAHNIALQTLAAGGVVLLISFGVFAIRLLRAAAVIDEPSQFSVALFASVSCWLVFGIVENLLIDRYLYVLVGLVVGLQVAQRVRPKPPRTDWQEPLAPAPATGVP